MWYIIIAYSPPPPSPPTAATTSQLAGFIPSAPYVADLPPPHIAGSAISASHRPLAVSQRSYNPESPWERYDILLRAMRRLSTDSRHCWKDGTLAPPTRLSRHQQSAKSHGGSTAIAGLLPRHLLRQEVPSRRSLWVPRGSDQYQYRTGRPSPAIHVVSGKQNAMEIPQGRVGYV